MKTTKKSKTEIIFLSVLALIIAGSLYGLFALGNIGADQTNETKKSEVMSQARFQINPQASWDAPAAVTFRVAAARWMFYGVGVGAGGQIINTPEQYPKVTGRFFCNKPFLPGYNYPTGLYETPDYIFQDGAPFPPTDVMDGHNGMSYTYLPSEMYESSYNTFWSMTVPSTYQATCNYTQPGEYWPLFYADGLGAWFTQKIVVTGNGVVPSPIPSPTPTPSPIDGKILYQKGFNVIGFNATVQTDVFGKNGFKIFDYNPDKKIWDVYNTVGEFLFQPNRAYYIYNTEDKYVDQVTSSRLTTTDSRKMKPGWNFVWLEDTTYMSGLRGDIYTSNNQCLGKNIQLKN